MNPLIDLAVQARNHAYSPYSNRKVGSAIRLNNGKTYTGCNVENSSFGGTVCAERVAIWKAISEEGPHVSIVEVAVATDASPPWSPCGMCRQVINEFADPKCTVHLVNLEGSHSSHAFKDLFPHGFDRNSLMNS